MPAQLPVPLENEIHALIARCFQALGIQSGVLKGDLLVTATGRIYVLEMAARTSGGRFADTVVPLSTGVNILYPLIEMAMGDDFSRDWFRPTRDIGVSQRFFLHAGKSRVQRWPALRRLVGQPDVADWHLSEDFLRSGELPEIHCHGDRLGYVICTAPSRGEADAKALAITHAFAEAIQFENPQRRTETSQPQPIVPAGARL